LDKTDLIDTEKMQQLLCRVMVGLHPPISAITDGNADCPKLAIESGNIL
jgi:hypothetical protein